MHDCLATDAGERRDKFKAKPADASGSPNHVVGFSSDADVVQDLMDYINAPPQCMSRTLLQVRAMAFSPDSTKLALAQSDNIVFVYKCVGLTLRMQWWQSARLDAPNHSIHTFTFFALRLGEGWGDKKCVCGKFLQSAPITCMVWPRNRDDIVFALMDGSVKLGQVRMAGSCASPCRPMQAHGSQAFTLTI